MVPPREILEEADVSVVMFGSGMTVGQPLACLTKQLEKGWVSLATGTGSCLTTPCLTFTACWHPHYITPPSKPPK